MDGRLIKKIVLTILICLFLVSCVKTNDVQNSGCNIKEEGCD